MGQNQLKRESKKILNNEIVSISEQEQLDSSSEEENEETSESQVVQQEEEQQHSIKNFKATDLVLMVDDQHINLEILKQHVSKLGIEQNTRYFINGQQVVDAVKEIVNQSIGQLNIQEQSD